MRHIAQQRTRLRPFRNDRDTLVSTFQEGGSTRQAEARFYLRSASVTFEAVLAKYRRNLISEQLGARRHARGVISSSQLSCKPHETARRRQQTGDHIGLKSGNQVESHPGGQ